MPNFTEVQPVPAAPPRVGSLLGSIGVTQEPDTRWANGIVWRPETCFSGETWSLCASSGSTPQGGVDGGLAYHAPTALRAEFTCGNRYGNDPAADTARVQRQLEAASSFLLARELWLGTHTQASPYDTPQASGVVNGNLADGNANVIAGHFEPLEAIGLLEETARAAILGQQVTIHMPIVLLPYFANVVTDRNGTLFTQAGSKVIADSGYDGSGPSDSAATPGLVWMYATAPVQVRLSSIAAYNFPTIANNTRTFVAERAGAATYDPCGHFGLAVALPGDVTTP